MTGIAYVISEQDLHAYVDDVLGADRREAVEAYLAENPEAAAKVASYWAQRQTLLLLPHSTEPLGEPTRALCRELARRLTSRPIQARLEWNKRPGRRVSLSSGR